MEKLDERQEQVMDTIKKFIAKYGYPPTVRELGKELHMTSPASVQYHLRNLEKKGYIRRRGLKNRALEIMVPNEYMENNNVIDVALIGTITAGNPIEAIENPDEYFSVPVSLIPKKAEVFALNVKGTSMINKGINDGDIVLIEKRKTANNGEIVAAMTDENEVTLKTFYKEKTHIRLQPENDTMKPIILDNVTILGKAVGLYRKI